MAKSKENQLIELKPCPFCGGEAEFSESNRQHRGGDIYECVHHAGCKKCNIWFSRVSKYKVEFMNVVPIENGMEYVIKMWNSRA